MLLSTALVTANYSGPPPQAVIDRKTHWQFLVIFLVLLALLRFLTLDLVGAILSGLMLSMALNMVGDGMREMPRYALVFGVLCSLCFLFDTIPLLCSISGRSEVTITPLEAVKTRSSDVNKLTYSTTVRTTPFFDRDQGYIYNGTSVCMIVAPLVMAFGGFLSLHAHVKMEESMQPLLEERSAALWAQGGAGGGGIDTEGGSAAALGAGEGPRHPSYGVSRFQGTAHRLACAEAA